MNVLPVKFRNPNRKINGGKATHNVIAFWTVLRGFLLKTSIGTNGPDPGARDTLLAG